MLKRIVHFFKDLFDCISKNYFWKIQRCPGCEHIKITSLYVVDGDEGYLCAACWEK